MHQLGGGEPLEDVIPAPSEVEEEPVQDQTNLEEVSEEPDAQEQEMENEH